MNGYNKITLQANERYVVTSVTENCYGLWIVKEIKVVGTIVLFLSEPKNGIVIGEINNTNNMITITVGRNNTNNSYEVAITNNDSAERQFLWKKIA